MASIEYTGIERYLNDFREAFREAQIIGVSKQAVYEGQRVAADKVRQTIQNWPTHGDAKEGMTKIEKTALLSGLGTSQIVSQGEDVAGKLGVAGYGQVPTKQWPNGVPIPLTARSLINGTSWRKKDDFMKKAVNGMKSEVIEAMTKKVEEEFSLLAKATDL